MSSWRGSPLSPRRGSDGDHVSADPTPDAASRRRLALTRWERIYVGLALLACLAVLGLHVAGRGIEDAEKRQGWAALAEGRDPAPNTDPVQSLVAGFTSAGPAQRSQIDQDSEPATLPVWVQAVRSSRLWSDPAAGESVAAVGQWQFLTVVAADGSRLRVQLPGLEVHGFCRPARTVSGDYYDFLPIDSHRMVMAVGDVSGKGISAALLMATIHSAVRAYSLEGIPILRESMAASRTEGQNGLALAVHGVEVSTAALLTLLNHQLYESTPAEKYATMFLGFYDGRECTLTYSNAGHLPPIILGQGGAIRRLDRGGTAVGLFGEVVYDETVVQISDGDIFLAYSDGVTEPENDYGEFGEQRLINLVWENRHLPLAKISEIVTAAVDDWIGANEQPDDVTLVLARVR